LEKPAAFIFRVKMMVYSEVGEGDSPEGVGRCVYMVIIIRLLHRMFGIALDK
jgi:hypothetical protein